MAKARAIQATHPKAKAKAIKMQAVENGEASADRGRTPKGEARQAARRGDRPYG